MSAQCQHGVLRYECWKCHNAAKEPTVTMTEGQALKLTKEIDEARRIFTLAVDERNDLRAERDKLKADLAAALAERDKWHQAFQSMLDPIVRAKMLEPAPPMIAPVGMAEQVLLRERDQLREDLAAARALLRDTQQALDKFIRAALAGEKNNP